MIERCGWRCIAVLGLVMSASTVFAQSGLAGSVRDETGGGLPGVLVEAHAAGSHPMSTETDAAGAYRLRLDPGRCEVSFTLINFGPVRRALTVASPGTLLPLNVVMHLSLSADVTVTGKRTFTNLADVERPAENLVGIAQSASQGAITARQLDARPIMRTAEVLETVPGVVIYRAASRSGR